MMEANTWLNELHHLVNRHGSLGLQADIADMNLADLWGVYRFLRRLEGEVMP